GRFAVASAGADKLEYRRFFAQGGGKVAGVVHWRVVDPRARRTEMLQSQRQARDLAVVGSARRAKARPGLETRCRFAHGVQTGHLDRAELLREALDPAAVHGKVLVDPDVDTAAYGRALKACSDHHEKLPVLGVDGIGELVQIGRAR